MECKQRGYAYWRADCGCAAHEGEWADKLYRCAVVEWYFPFTGNGDSGRFVGYGRQQEEEWVESIRV